MKTSQRIQQMDTSGIRKVFALAKDLKDPIDLSIGQPDFLVPQNIKDAACHAIQQDNNRYALTQGIDVLREAVVLKLKNKNHISVQKENILITSAVSGGLSIALPCIIDHGDEVIIFDPYFVGYKQLILLYGGVPVCVKKNDDFSLNFETLEQAVTDKTRAIIFNTPENPTGHVSSRAEVEALVDFARRHDLTVIADEIYEDFVYDGEHISIGSLYDKTVTLGGFSKSHAITGWRIGYLCAPDAFIQEMIKVQQYTFVCAPTPLQYAALEALQTDMSHYVTQYKKKRDMVYDGLKDHYTMVRSDGAFYFFVAYPYDAETFIARCMAHDLLVIPGNVFSVHNTHFRISFATSDEKLRKAITILKKIAR
ncbi:MAG: aminotransferase class I/II-fold pyridoxal phosphate-dependent enzyme [Parcubacteria group bacterium]|jgi:aspartate aminotransferase/aminotransferase